MQIKCFVLSSGEQKYSMNKCLIVVGFVDVLALIYLYTMVMNLNQLEKAHPEEQSHIGQQTASESLLQTVDPINKPVSGIATDRFPRISKAEASPWEGTPEFILFVRLTSGYRWDREYNNVLVRSMKLFFPADRAKLLVVLDREKEQDHRLGKRLQKEWPYPNICYMDPGKPAVYHNLGKSRMYWDMLHPDKCTNVPYVGFVDTDTFFTTFVTPSLLFENGKPVIVGVIGEPNYSTCWAFTTEKFLGRKEVVQCMTYFPVMIKTEHLKEMR